MNPSDTAAALARAAAFDRRTVGEVEARAWAEAMPADYTLPEVIAAIVAHYTASTDFLMPAHVVKIVKADRAAKRQAITASNYNAVPDADPDDVPAYLEALRQARLVDRSPRVGVPARPVAQLIAAALANRKPDAS